MFVMLSVTYLVTALILMLFVREPPLPAEAPVEEATPA